MLAENDRRQIIQQRTIRARNTIVWVDLGRVLARDAARLAGSTISKTRIAVASTRLATASTPTRGSGPWRATAALPRPTRSSSTARRSTVGSNSGLPGHGPAGRNAANRRHGRRRRDLRHRRLRVPAAALRRHADADANADRRRPPPPRPRRPPRPARRRPPRRGRGRRPRASSVPRTGPSSSRARTTPASPTAVFTYGLPGDKPVVGDWTAKGFRSIGVYRGRHVLPAEQQHERRRGHHLRLRDERGSPRGGGLERRRGGDGGGVPRRHVLPAEQQYAAAPPISP